jgi:hypothetical protein
VLVLREVVIAVDALELGFDGIGSWEGTGVSDAKQLSWSLGIWRVSPKLSRNGSEKESNTPRSNPESGLISNSRGRWSWKLAVDGMSVSGASWSIGP